MDQLGGRLRRLRLQARAVLLFERVWPALWPPLGVLGLVACAGLLDLPRRLPGVLHAALLLAALGAFGWLLWRGLRAVRLPDDAQADRRLEAASGLRHRPLAALSDRPALPGEAALWRAHLARVAAQIGRLRTGLPRPGLAARDPRALRAGLLVALAACLGIAGEDAPARLARAALPRFAPAVPAPPTEVQAWITPPGYTNLPPLVLRPDGGAVSAPAGSHLTVSLSGGSGGAPALALADKALAFPAVDAGSFQADADLTEGGRLVVRRDGAEVAGWDLSVAEDTPPLVHWTEPPGAAKGGGRAPLTRLPWDVAHEYGVVALQAELHLSLRPDAPPLVVAIPLPNGSAKAAKGVKLQDLTAHPWAGVAVTGHLVARDAPGLTGASEDADFTLPERRFDNPTAKALLTVRKTLTLWPEDRLPSAGELDRIARQDELWRDDLGGYLNLRAIIAELRGNRDPGAVADAQERLWQLALHLEEGGAERTARTLAQARRDLRELMEARKHGEPVDKQQIDRRIAALQQAIQQRLDELAEQLRRDPQAQLSDPDQQQRDAHDAQTLAEQLRQAEQQGDQQAAERTMAELEELLDQLQAAKPMHRDAQQKQRAEKRRQGEQQMNALQDLVRREGGVLDRAQARAGQPTPSPGQPQLAPRSADPNAAERQTDQRVQQALRRAVGELMQRYSELTGDVPKHLGAADTAMRAAIEALGKGSDRGAATAAQAAIEALQQGGQSMSEQLAQQFGQPGDQADQDGDQQGEQPGSGLSMGDPRDGDQQGPGRGGQRPWQGRPGQGHRGDRRTDPLGRPLAEGNNGGNESNDLTLPEERELARTRAIQDELRRREGERTRPQPELDYIERLLKQF